MNYALQQGGALDNRIIQEQLRLPDVYRHSRARIIGVRRCAEQADGRRATRYSKSPESHRMAPSGLVEADALYWPGRNRRA